jgi:hypothetical protein
MSGDHNMNQTDSGWRKRQIALDKKAENARELGLNYEPVFTYDQVKAHIQAAMLSEREACARLCEDLRKKEIAHWNAYGMDGSHYSAGDCAAAIRARENT